MEFKAWLSCRVIWGWPPSLPPKSQCLYVLWELISTNRDVVRAKKAQCMEGSAHAGLSPHLGKGWGRVGPVLRHLLSKITSPGAAMGSNPAGG